MDSVETRPRDTKYGVGFDTRPTKRACVVPPDHSVNYDDGGRDVGQAESPPDTSTAPVDLLTDDVLYYLFHGVDINETPLFPPQCRWVPALVCRRWRTVVASITRADAHAVTGRLRDALWDGPLPEKVHHHSVVRASGMALMVRHGLPTRDMGAWTTQTLKPIVVATVLAASSPEHMDEAMGMVRDMGGLDEWSRYVNYHLNFILGRCGSTKHCRWPFHARHALMIAAAGSWQDLDALVSMAQTCAPCCVKIAALHAARRGRIDAVRALLAAMPPQDDGNLLTVHNAIHGMWSLVGHYGLISLGRFLLDIEADADPVIRYTAEEREHLARVRSGDNFQYDFAWDWLHEAAQHDQAACLDLCIERGLPTQPTEWAGTALFSKSAAFYAKIGTRWDLEAYGRSLFMGNALYSAVAAGKPLQEGALLWIAAHPDFDPLLQYARRDFWPPDDTMVSLVEILFDYARDYYTVTPRTEMAQAAAVVAQRWPDVWTDFGERLCLRSVAIAAESDMKVDDCIP